MQVLMGAGSVTPPTMSRARLQPFAGVFWEGLWARAGDRTGRSGFRHGSILVLQRSRLGGRSWRSALVKRRTDELLSIDYSHSRNRPGLVNIDSRALGGPREVGGGAISGTGYVSLG